MKPTRSIRYALFAAASFAATLHPAMAQSQADIVAEVTAVDKAYQALKGDARGAVMVPDYVEVHSSGWAYDKKQELEFWRNGDAYVLNEKVIKSSSSTPVVKIYNGNTAVITGTTEVYYAVPNEEDMATAAGTHEREYNAVAKWLKEQDSPNHKAGPGEGYYPNPARKRYVHVWVKTDGKWMLVYTQATRLGQRGSQVLLGEAQP